MSKAAPSVKDNKELKKTGLSIKTSGISAKDDKDDDKSDTDTDTEHKHHHHKKSHHKKHWYDDWMVLSAYVLTGLVAFALVAWVIYWVWKRFVQAPVSDALTDIQKIAAQDKMAKDGMVPITANATPNAVPVFNDQGQRVAGGAALLEQMKKTGRNWPDFSPAPSVGGAAGLDMTNSFLGGSDLIDIPVPSQRQPPRYQRRQ